jgi:hypothetical protein
MCDPDWPVRGSDLGNGRDRLKSTYRHRLQNIKSLWIIAIYKSAAARQPSKNVINLNHAVSQH